MLLSNSNIKKQKKYYKNMSKLKTNSMYALASIMAVSGVLAHCLHLEGLVVGSGLHSDAKSERLVSAQHTHIETNSYGSTTFGMRSQPPAARPQDDGDKDTLLKKRISSDGFGNDYSSWAI